MKLRDKTIIWAAGIVSILFWAVQLSNNRSSQALGAGKTSNQ